MKNNIKGILISLLLFSSLSAMGQSYMASPRVRESMSYNSNALNLYTSKIKQALYFIYNGYVDSVKLDELAQTAVTKMIQELDPHSTYISAKEIKEMEEPLLGKFEGIGVEYAIIADTLTIQSVILGGPSDKVGLKAGDKINRVNGEVISGADLTATKAIKYLRGPKGSKVSIGYIRRGEPEREVVITRDVISTNTVDCAYQISDGILYTRISRFGAQTYQELMSAVYRFQGQNELKGLILDLRGNGGGYLSAAQKIVNEFLNRGELILYIEGRSIKRVNDIADGTGRLKNINVAVLIDEGSASASEIVAGAIQDWDRGVIIGRRSFGKGLVQQQYPLADGSAIRVTIARYHTPSGRVIQSPYSKGNSTEYYQNVMRRYLSDERFNKDSIKVNDSLKFKTLRLKRDVYGGGGIIPDIFIPLDTSYYSNSYIKSVNSGNLSEFVGIWADNHREEYTKKYGTFAGDSYTKGLVFDKFCNDFVVTKEYLDSFLQYCSTKDNKYTQEDLEKSKDVIISNLKGLIIRNLYGLDYYLRYINKTDKEVLTAVEELTK